MTLQELAEYMGLETYPASMQEFYSGTAVACDLQLLERLQKDHNLFGAFYGDVVESAKRINALPAYNTWVQTASKFVLNSGMREAMTLPAANGEDSFANKWLMLHIMIPQIAQSVRLYQQRGFEQEEVACLLQAYQKSIEKVRQQTGQPGISKGYYNWLMLYAKAMIFEVGGFEFEVRTLPATACFLQNKKTGQLFTVMIKGTFHKSGIQPVGSAGYESEEGAFTVSFEEDAENYYGHGIYDHMVDRSRRAYAKTEWVCVAKPGDPCFGLHIPAGADISPQALDRALLWARQIAEERYPEFSIRILFGNSWIFDPKLEKLLSEKSRIVALLKRFTKYPQKDGGKAALSFVFGKYKDYESLPENTSLERKLKKLYLSGGCIHGYCGILML